MIPEPCRVSKPLAARRKELRMALSTWQKEWISGFGVVDRAYVHDIRQAHILRMDGLPKTYPDGRPLPKASQGHLPSQKPRTGKGKRRRPLPKTWRGFKIRTEAEMREVDFPFGPEPE